MEAAKQYGGWESWLRLTEATRAKLLAHEMHRNMREHYEYDQRAPAEKKPGGNTALAPWVRMREAFLNGAAQPTP